LDDRPKKTAQRVWERLGGSSNYLFTDGHTEQLSWEQVKKRLENPKDRLTDPTR
jgi:prepilin-type processing-associated H-X9-DG protein